VIDPPFEEGGSKAVVEAGAVVEVVVDVIGGPTEDPTTPMSRLSERRRKIDG